MNDTPAVNEGDESEFFFGEAPPPAESAAFETFRLITALHQFSRGLWTIFIGVCLMLGAAVAMIVATAVQAGPNWLNVAVLACALCGFILLLSGKRTTYSFAAPLRYRKYLIWSYWCDMGVIAVRWFLIPAIGRAAALFAAPLLGILSIWFLLRFIYCLAGLIGAQWARRFSVFCQWAVVATLGLHTIQVIVRVTAPDADLASLLPLVILTSALFSFVSFLILLATMSVALRSFARFLESDLR